MMSITVAAVGKLKEKYYADACAEYLKRLGVLCKIDVIEIAETRLPSDPSDAEIAAALRTEAAKIMQAIPHGATLVALCIEGEKCSSEKLASAINGFANSGVSKLAFIIGGSFGLDETLKKQAAVRLSMSDMTFPHHLARVMLLEQLYRAFSINAGTKYHK